MNYSIRYQDDHGITERSEFLAFESDADAVAHAKADAPRHAIVEIWKGDQLLSRAFKVPQ
jgi:hypothetical protein